MDLNEFKAFAPRADGKFSPNLYKHLLRSKAPFRPGFRVFHFTRDYIDGRPTVPGAWNPTDIWIGDELEGRLIGTLLFRLIHDRCPSEASSVSVEPGSFTEVTDAFWEAYAQHGRCAFDRAHRIPFQGGDIRYTVVGNTRRCNWCGQWHHAVNRKKAKIVRSVQWVPDHGAVLHALHP